MNPTLKAAIEKVREAKRYTALEIGRGYVNEAWPGKFVDEIFFERLIAALICALDQKNKWLSSEQKKYGGDELAADDDEVLAILEGKPPSFKDELDKALRSLDGKAARNKDGI